MSARCSYFQQLSQLSPLSRHCQTDRILATLRFVYFMLRTPSWRWMVRHSLSSRHVKGAVCTRCQRRWEPCHVGIIEGPAEALTKEDGTSTSDCFTWFSFVNCISNLGDKLGSQVSKRHVGSSLDRAVNNKLWTYNLELRTWSRNLFPSPFRWRMLDFFRTALFFFLSLIYLFFFLCLSFSLSLFMPLAHSLRLSLSLSFSIFSFPSLLSRLPFVALHHSGSYLY